jgi:hypothetical protein
MALIHFEEEAIEKVMARQARIVEWDSIKDHPPPELKISPIAAIPHKSRGFQSILDLSFNLRLSNGRVLLSVNDTTIKTALKGALDQLGHALYWIIHAFAEAEDDENTKIFMAKWDVKDGFWQMCSKAGEEWNFTYLLPQPEGEPMQLVFPTSLQMEWVEFPPYFCAALETARDIAMDYGNTQTGSLTWYSQACVIACQSVISGTFKNISRAKAREPGLLPTVVATVVCMACIAVASELCL